MLQRGNALTKANLKKRFQWLDSDQGVVEIGSYRLRCNNVWPNLVASSGMKHASSLCSMHRVEKRNLPKHMKGYHIAELTNARRYFSEFIHHP